MAHPTVERQTQRTAHLDVAISDSGPRDRSCVLLLHGWPDDSSTWIEVGGRLNEAGFRTVAPMHRGFGGTRFLSHDTPRTGNVAILAMDAIELADAMSIDRFFVAGHDWGSNIAETLALGWPDRVPRIAMMSTPSRLGGLPTPVFAQARRQWYHWFQATKRGEEAVRKDPKGFARIMWETWSPDGWFSDQTFDRIAASFENPDWVDVTLHSYRSRWGEADVDPRSTDLDHLVLTTKTIATPTVFVQGGADGVTPPGGSESMQSKFSGSFERVVLEGVGHFPPREAPEAVAETLIAHFQS